MPTVILYALFLGAYKASGLVERITVALHPLLRPFGLSGRDLVRVIMGFGCNVPAVINTRACSSCPPADLRECDRLWFGLFLPVWGHPGGLQRRQFAPGFSGALPGLPNPDHPDLHPPDCAPKPPVLPRMRLMIERRTFLEMPRWSAIWREPGVPSASFSPMRSPSFLVITIIAFRVGLVWPDYRSGEMD